MTAETTVIISIGITSGKPIRITQSSTEDGLQGDLLCFLGLDIKPSINEGIHTRVCASKQE